MPGYWKDTFLWARGMMSLKSRFVDGNTPFGFHTYLNSTETPRPSVCWFSGKGTFPSMTRLGMLDISYNLRTLANCSARENDSPKRPKRLELKEFAVWLMSVREASEIGIDAGYWTARRVKTI